MTPIERQANSLLDNGVHLNEARLIARTYLSESCEDFVDLGSSFGVLAFRVLALLSPATYLGVDANPACVEFSKNLIGQRYPDYKGASFLAATILPDYMPKARAVRGCENDLANTSSLYTKHTGAVSFDSARISIAEYLSDLSPSTFLKIDLEGIDVDVVGFLIKNSLLPRAFQFELHPSQMRDATLPYLLGILNARGYKVPKLSWCREALFISVCTSRSTGSAIRTIAPSSPESSSATGFTYDFKGFTHDFKEFA